MGAEYQYTCEKCGFYIITSGPWEFSRDERGGLIFYMEMVEPETGGIDGLSGSIYCPDCNKVYDMILVEFDQPEHTNFNIWSLWSDPGNSFLKQNEVKCAVCGGNRLILEPEDNIYINCPNCNLGVLKGDLKGIL